jgi:hypothetical protein
VTTKPPLQKILQGILHTESETQHNHERTGKLQEKKRQEHREKHQFSYTQSNPQKTKTTK